MDTERVFHTFGPVYDSESRILILGSFPSVVSRRMNFYYANPGNRFWRLLADLFGEEINDRKQFCLDHHIALWDVIASCRIHGSSDASITDVKVNDIQSIVDQSRIKTVFTTGKKAADLYEKLISCDAEHIALPSTSGANAAMSFAMLRDKYHIIVEKLYEEN
ncbi:MAG: DNA-deoxyinosine glycosylase [Solobacterium sp.]|nr:DNA-deoxyinosine glycosylase [Solobacterium sp.]